MTSETPQAPATKTTKQLTRATLKLVLTYALFAGLWILLSDKVMLWLFNDLSDINLASTLKGWLFVAVTSLLLFGLVQRLVNQAQRASLSEQEAVITNKRTQRLLVAIADSSTDAIFAKDLAGRYLLFNRETARVIGKTAEQALGQDDTALFPEQVAMIQANDRLVIEKNKNETFEETITGVD